MKVIVIGGGPAGMLAGISAAKQGHKVIILEKMNSLGRKLLITGKGRCNITSSLPMEEFIKNTPGNGMFLYSAFKAFTNEDIINLLKQNGLNVKEERGNRVFPVTDKSIDVLNALLKELKKLKVEIRTDTKVNKILVNENKVCGVLLGDNQKLEADKIVLATGGKSYPATGSTGDGYKMVEELGHTITKIKPSLVPLQVKNNDLLICKQMQGLSLKNVKINLIDKSKNKVIYEDFGEMIFTHFGVSGPTILSAAAHLLRYKNVDELFKEGKIALNIDLKPALTEEKLNLRLLRDFEKNKNKKFKNCLDDLLPKKMIETIITISQIDEKKQVNSITKKERESLVKLLKNFEIVISDLRPIEDAIITSGGINIKEINPKTMESKIVNGLFFAGEIIDVDSYTGGFNLQIAYSTGYVAGTSAGLVSQLSE